MVVYAVAFEALLCLMVKVVDFESESETDKTGHIRKRLHALAASTTARDHSLQEEGFRQKADSNSGRWSPKKLLYTLYHLRRWNCI